MESIRALCINLLTGLARLTAAIIFAGGACSCFADSYNFKGIDPPQAAMQANGNGINNSGQIVGSYADGTRGHGFLLNADFSDIDYPGSSYTAYGVSKDSLLVVL